MREDVLQTAIANAEKVLDGLSEAVAEPIREMMARYEDHIDGLEEAHGERVSELEEEINGFDEDARTDADSSEDAINKFLDCVDRPVGTRDFTIPKTGESTRALIGLYDAINRKL